MTQSKCLVLLLGMMMTAFHLAGCGPDESGSDDDKGHEKQTGHVLEEPPTLISNVWQGTCSPKSRLEGYAVREFVKYLENGRFSRLEEYYSDEKCQNAMFTLRYAGDYLESGDSLHVAGARKIDMTFIDAYLTPSSEEGAVLMNERKSCGQEEWVAGTEVDVTRFSVVNQCESQIMPDYRYDIYLIQGTRLYLGKETEYYHRMVPGRRPQEMNFEIAFTQSDRELTVDPLEN